MIKATILASGHGTNAYHIWKWCQENGDQKKISIEAIISNRADAGVIKRMSEVDQKVLFISQEERILEKLLSLKVEWIFLAGYMKILSPQFLDHFYCKKLNVYKVINIHPSLLPSFPGKDGYGEAYAYGVKYSGITLHFVDHLIDRGPIIIQKVLERLDHDSFNDFKERGLKLEYQVYQEFLSALVNSQIQVKWQNDRSHINREERPYVILKKG